MKFTLSPWNTSQILKNIHVGDWVRFKIGPGTEDEPEKIKTIGDGQINFWLIDGGGSIRLVKCPHKKHMYSLTKKTMPKKYISVVKMEEILGKEKTEKLLKSLTNHRRKLSMLEPLSVQDPITMSKCLKVKKWADMRKILKCKSGSEFHAFAKLAYRYLKNS